MSISIKDFGKVNNQQVSKFEVTNNNGLKAVYTNLGATIISIFVPDNKGNVRDVVLGFDNLDDYIINHCYFGATIGRSGNRIQNATFKINGQEYFLDKNERNKNNLHSGINGYQKRLWDYEISEATNSVKFMLLSPDMDQGYPGNFNVSVTYTLTDTNELKIDYDGISDKDTVANLTNHSYFNLNGHDSGTILDHDLQINSNKFAIIDDESIPTGELQSVKWTPLDFTSFRRLGDEIDTTAFDQMVKTKGYDHSFLLDRKTDSIEKVAIAKSDKSGISMEVYTDCVALQFYAGNYIDEIPQVGKGNHTYVNRSGLCLETGFLPNSINEPNFASPILKAGDKYHSTTIYKFITNI